MFFESCFNENIFFRCTRIFWSTKNPRVRVKYTCRIKEIRPPESNNNSDLCPNVTTVHGILPLKKENCSKVFPDLTLRPLDSLKKNEYSKLNSCKNQYSSFENSDIPSAVMDDVIKVVHRLIKKVIKKQKSYWGKVRCKLSTHSDKVLFNGKNTFSDHSNLSESCAKSNTDPCQESLFSKQFGYKVNEILNSINTNSDFKENVTTFDNEKNCGQLKYPEILKKYILTSKLKQLKKKLKYYSINKQNFEISEKLMDCMSDKEIAEEIRDFLLKRYRKGAELPPKLASFLDTLKPCSINETIFPVFISSKENSGINESSGYSSNEDSHLRPPMHSQNSVCVSRSENKSQNEVSLKSNIRQKTNDGDELSWMKGIKLNGQKDFKQNLGSSSSRSTNTGMPEHSVSRLKGLNGISQSTGPHKCSKCKRLYRTNESFEKHTESCNFVVDSSSTEEESSDSSDGSEESYESSSDENMPKELSRIPLKKPLSIIVDQNAAVNKQNFNSTLNSAKSIINYKSDTLKKQGEHSVKIPKSQSSYINSSRIQSNHTNNSRILSSHIINPSVQSSQIGNPRVKSSHTNYPRIQPNQKENNSRSAASGKSMYLKNYGNVQNNAKQFQRTPTVNIPYQQMLNLIPNIQYEPAQQHLTG